MKPNFIKILVLFLSCITNIYGSGSSYFLQQLDITHGLSQSKVSCIYYDYKGYLWVGTPYGLNRYDRDEIKQFFHLKSDDTSLPSNEILFIQEDKHNNLWIGTTQGLCKYNRGNSNFERIKYEGKPLIAYSILQVKDDLYFGGSKQIFKFQNDQQDPVMYPLKSDIKLYTNFTQMIPLDEKNVVINTNIYGIYNYNFDDHKLTYLDYIPKGNSPTIFIDSHKRLWISEYGQGLYCYENGQILKHFTTQNSLLSYNVILTMEEKDGYLWLGTDGGGIQLISLDDLTFKASIQETDEISFFPTNAVNCLYKDPMNNMWAGTVRSGVIYIYEVDAQSYQKVTFGNSHGLSNQTINCIYEDPKGYIWLGTDGGGLNRYDPRSKQFKHYPSTQNEKVTSIIEYNTNELLTFFFYKGMYIVNKESGAIRPFKPYHEEMKNLSPQNSISTFILELPNNQIMFSDVNLSLYDKKSRKYKIIGTRGKDFERFSPLLRKSKDGNVYIVDRFKILNYDLETQKLSTCYKGEDIIQEVSIDSHKNFWIATKGGLVRYSPRANKIEKIKPDLLKSINSVIADDNDFLWIGTSSNRLFLYDVSANLLSLLGESDGFITNEYSFGSMFVSTQDEAYIGGTMGLTIAGKNMAEKQMAHIETKDNTIELVDLFVNGKPYDETNWEKGEEIRLPWNFYSLQLKLRVKEDNIFRKHAFKYIISSENNSENIHSFSHSLTIHALHEGNHTISASYITQKGEWSEPTILAHVKVVPPWWKSNYFKFALFILIILIIFLIGYALFTHEEKMRRREINQLNNKVTQDRIRFLVNIGHELKTPLTLISAPLKQIIEHDAIPAHLSQKLENIYKQAMKIKELVDMVLDVKKLKNGEEVLHLASYSLNSWIKEATEPFSDELHNHSINLAYELDSHIGSVPFDKEKCSLVISNMVMNAIKFSQDNTTITIRTEMTGFNTVKVYVIDEGIGLKDEDIPNLFSFYYQGKEEQSGSGIGLSYCKLLIDLHNGKIGAYRNRDKGSTFYFELPLSAENVTTFEAEVAVQCPETADDFKKLKAYSILLIIEVTELRHYLKDVLKDRFNHVYVAKNGQEGMDFIHKYNPDIVTSDAIMSKMSGFMVCKAIKDNPSTCHIPIILLTAYYNATNMQTGYRMGADAFLSKPFDIDTLLSIIYNQLILREAIKQRYQGFESLSNSTKDSVVINNADEEFVEKLNAIIEENIMNADLNVEFLTKALGISRTALFNKVKEVTNLGIIDYINGIRIKKAMDLLKNTKLNVTEISEKVGFSYPQYFGKVFRKQTNMSPSEYRNACDGENKSGS